LIFESKSVLLTYQNKDYIQDMKRILLISLIVLSFSAFACSSKDQLTINIQTVDKSNFPHKAYVALGKKLFNDDLLAGELHAYDVAINHSSGTLVFDIESDKMKEQILKKINRLLSKQGLEKTRMTYDKLQKLES